MILGLHILEIGLLVAVLFALRKRPVIEKRAPVAAPSAAAPAQHWATLIPAEAGWIPDGKFVREGTPAWNAAYEECGRALRSPDGVLTEGKQ